MKNKVTLLVSLMLMVCLSINAQKVNLEDAKVVSKNFMTEMTGRNNFETTDFQLIHTEKDEKGNELFYRFQIKDKGFIVVSAIDLATPVLAFSLEDNFGEDNISKDYFLQKYKEEFVILKQNPELAKNSHAAWKHYQSAEFNPKQRVKSADPGVQPLLTTAWSQTKYYNADCPFDSRPDTIGGTASRDNRTLVGCVAVSVANLLFYHRYPDSGEKGVSYVTGYIDDNNEIQAYPRQTVLFSEQTYNYSAMTELSLNTYVREVSKLLHHVGVSVRMGYGNNASGSKSADALTALKNHWKMPEDCRIITKEVTQMPAFLDTILNQLKRNLPVYFSATQNGKNGHAFMIDGYVVTDSAVYLHANYGWGGSKNGYYAFGNLYGYNSDENVIINVMPVDLEKPAISTDTVTATLGSISDGSGAVKYAKNSNRSWLIQTPYATSYAFNFSKIKTVAGKGVITIYNGATVSSGIKEQFSGNYLMKNAGDAQGAYFSNFGGAPLPGIITVNSTNGVLITFTSDNSETDYGFVLNYSATVNNTTPICLPASNIPASQEHGVLSDKGANYQNADSEATYRADRTCSWVGSYFNAVSGFNMEFRKFDLEPGDYVEILNIDDKNQPELIVKFDASYRPQKPFTVNCGKFQVNFVSDNWLQGKGFELEYTAIKGTTDIEEYSGFNSATIYPNPTSRDINVKILSELNETMTVQISDMTGRLISSENVQVMGNHVYTRDVSNLSKGIYVMKLQTSKGKSIQKFIVE